MSDFPNCTTCGRRALVPRDADAEEDTLARIQAASEPACDMVCAYCDAKKTVRGVSDSAMLDYLTYAPSIRDAFAAEKRREHEKVARLAEGRW